MKDIKNLNRINGQITGVKEVRLVGDNITPGVYSFKDAYDLADKMELDLVEINSKQSPVICRILDYEKYLYDQKKKEKEHKQKVQETKEIRLSPQTDEHDIEFKVRHAIEFLKENNKVKVYVQFKGREINYKSQGEELLNKFIIALDNYGKPDKSPTLEGKRMFVLFNPKTNGRKNN